MPVPGGVACAAVGDPRCHWCGCGHRSRITAYVAEDRSKRVESERFKRFSYEEIVARDKASLDITWLRDESLEDTDSLPPPEVIADEIIQDLEAALVQFSAVAESLAHGGDS